MKKAPKVASSWHELTCCLERGVLHLSHVTGGAQRPLHKHKALSGDMQAARP